MWVSAWMWCLPGRLAFMLCFDLMFSWLFDLDLVGCKFPVSDPGFWFSSGGVYVGLVVRAGFLLGMVGCACGFTLPV